MSIRKHELNSLRILKGRIEGKRFPVWDSVKDCTSSCEIGLECEYVKEKKSNGKCKLQGHFLRTMMDITLDNLPTERRTEYSLQKIGLTLLPLFKQLISCQMLEQSLTDITVGEDSKLKIHPVYKEIRIITKDIDKCLRSLGIDKNPLADGEGIDPYDQTGDSGYYDSLIDDHEEESKRHNKKKRKIQ